MRGGHQMAARGGAGERRRTRSLDERKRIVEEALAPGISVAAVARRHGLNATQARQLSTVRQAFGAKACTNSNLTQTVRKLRLLFSAAGISRTMTTQSGKKREIWFSKRPYTRIEFAH